MSDFLTRLAQRQLGQLASVEPRLAELYAPVSGAAPLSIVDTSAMNSQTTPRLSEPWRPLPADASAVNVPAAEPFASPQGGASGVSSAAPRQQASSDRENISPRAGETLSAGRASAVLPDVSAEPRNIAPASRAGLAPEHSTWLPLRREARAGGPEAVGDAPRRLADAPIATAAAAPPRLEPKAREGVPAPALERAPDDAEPPIHVTIGRIEVTAVTAAPIKRRAPAPRQPPMSLDDYLARRQRRES